MKELKSYRMDKLTLAFLEELAEKSKINQTEIIRKSVMLYASKHLPNFDDVLTKNL